MTNVAVSSFFHLKIVLPVCLSYGFWLPLCMFKPFSFGLSHVLWNCVVLQYVYVPIIYCKPLCENTVETGQVISEDYMPKVCGNFTLLIHIGCTISTSWYLSCTWLYMTVSLLKFIPTINNMGILDILILISFKKNLDIQLV
jgi:hypothetical protein